MSVSLEIVPLVPSVDIQGLPESGLSTAYSLSGHVLISLASPVAFFESRPRPARLLLSSLELTFEGKSEFISGPSGYVAARIISVTKELLPDGHPIELTNEGLEDGAEPSTWQVIFNLALPGWLPASTIFGEDDVSSVSYSLFARATYSHIEDDHTSLALSWKPWKLASLCTAALRMRNKTACAKPVPVFVNRFSAHAPSFAHYSVRMKAPEGTPESNAVPAAVLTNIQVMASIPTHVSTTASGIPVSLRIRSTNGPEVTARLRINSFHVDLEQHEKYQTLRSQSYASAFPIPRSAQQPPSRPLLDPHPLETLYSLGLMCTPESVDNQMAYRTWSIVPDNQPLLFRLHEHAVDSDDDDDENPATASSGRIVQDSASLTPQGLVLENDGWHKISVSMPFVPAPIASTSAQTFFDDDDFASPGANYYASDRMCRPEKGLKESESHVARRILRPSFDSPFFKVRHEVRIAVTCSYRESADGPEYQSEMKFALPLKFVCALPADLTRPESPASSEASASSRSGSSTPMLPPPAPSPYPRTNPLGTNGLPAYSQLYHANGDWRDELYADLPAYSKDAEDRPLLDTTADEVVLGLAH